MSKPAAPNGDVVDWSDFGLVRAEPARPIPSGPQSVPEVISQAASTWPDREALVSRHTRYTYRQLAEEVDAATAALQSLGVRPGDRVAATAANHAEIVLAFFAAQRLGAVWVGVNRTLAAPEKRFILQDSGAAYYLAERAAVEQIEGVRESLPALRAVIEMEPGDAFSAWARLVAEHRGAAPDTPRIDPYAPAAIAYTSGTTGFPKGVVHSQHNIVLVGAMGRLAGRRQDVDRAGVALPLTILNLMILGPVASFQTGRACIVMDRVDSAGLAEWIARERVETFAAAPTMLHDLLTNPEVKPEDLASLKAPGAGGAPTPESLRDLYRKRFGRELTTSYGLTEAPTSVTMVDMDKPLVPGSSGQAIDHVRISIQDPDGRILPPGEVGEICVAGQTAGPFAGLYTPMLGYWRRPDATAEALRGGWLHTGDMGRMDQDGHVFVEGRRSDVILRGGANVYPAEIERVLHMDERVAACAVVGKPDVRLGEQVAAFVQPGPGVPDLEVLQADLADLCRQNLARYKVPAAWIFVTDFPRNAMNKIVKADLKKLHFGDDHGA